MSSPAWPVLVLLLSTKSLAADCPLDDASVAARVTAARAAVETTCPCAAATSAGAYRECARGVVRGLVGAGDLDAACQRTVLRCSQRSTCGRPGAVTCCSVRSNGTIRCAVKRDASKCPTSRPGYCVGALTSCCDACGPGGCVVPTTTTTTLGACGGGPGSCAGNCPTGLACTFVQDASPFCACTPDGSQPCGDAQAPFCNGTCPAGQRCAGDGIVPGLPCGCIPEGATGCDAANVATCSATCPERGDGPRVCAPFTVSTLDLCICVDGDAQCGAGSPPFGLCPPGDRCHVETGMCAP